MHLQTRRATSHDHMELEHARATERPSQNDPLGEARRVDNSGPLPTHTKEKRPSSHPGSARPSLTLSWSFGPLSPKSLSPWI
jgi:hypothetical protein